MVEQVLFYCLSAVVVVAALMMVTSKNVFHSALYLALSLFGVAGIYVLLNAYFLAGIQVLIYIGAVVVLAIFVINLTKQLSGSEYKQFNAQVIPAVLVSAATAFLVITAIMKSDWTLKATQAVSDDKTALIGRLLLTDFVIPFEVVSVLLLAALVGAVVIVSREKEAK